MAELRWAPPRREDDPEWAELLAAVEAVDQRGETYELDDLGDEWKSVWSHPEENARFVWDGSELVGFVWLIVRPGEREAHKLGQWGGVRPSRRGQGIGTQLFDWVGRRAAEIAPTLDAALPTKLETDAAQHQDDVKALATKAGYEPVRLFLEIARPTNEAVPEIAAPAGLELVPWSAELDEGARSAHTESFADHWGSEPRTREEWEQWYTGHRGFRSDLSVLAVEPASGEVVALVLISCYPQDWATVPIEAWINTVGTRRAWRGKGVASWLMADSLRRIAAADDGFERAILGVDAENPTGALSVYRRLGFDDDVRSVTTFNRVVTDA
jgi:mycothiol synthase